MTETTTATRPGPAQGGKWPSAPKPPEGESHQQFAARHGGRGVRPGREGSRILYQSGGQYTEGYQGGGFHEGPSDPRERQRVVIDYWRAAGARSERLVRELEDAFKYGASAEWRPGHQELYDQEPEDYRPDHLPPSQQKRQATPADLSRVRRWEIFEKQMLAQAEAALEKLPPKSWIER